jgi:hypothetical protein
MTNDKRPTPRNYKGVTISSTFTDLKDHRAALIKAIKGQGLTDVAMENDSAKPNLDVIDSSLQMVRDGSAYIGVISRKYGQTPECPQRNPGKLSITELEFNEAQRLDRPILLLIMGEKHPVIEADVESNATKKKKLKAFRERAKKMGPDSLVHRVYASFDSLEEFKEKAFRSISDLQRHLGDQATSLSPQESRQPESDSIPKPPALYAEPAYIGSHEFVGREHELITLDDWASPADPYSILLFEAIGGAGKSMITWEWANKWATTVRDDWAGRFWYSFYERGADMSDFCRRAMAYVTQRPLSDFRGQKTTRLARLLVVKLQARPWLLILDGLERVLVAYHRFDAAQVADEQVDTSKDQIASRDPCDAIRPEDDDLLRSLAAAAPSKLLITTRLTPRILLNPSGQGIPGVLRVPLPGLRPADAEALLRACGVTGNSSAMQNYLKSQCDCHPLVTGILAGLINDYLPNRGNFDSWAADVERGGSRLNLANLDLVQKRNHILRAALDALSEKSRQLLSILALLSESVDYKTLSALNPHLPPEPDTVSVPERPEYAFGWKHMSNTKKKETRARYHAALQFRTDYEQSVAARLESPEYLTAPQELGRTVHDLERRGLLQYDAQARRYDLHPVVRGISAGGLRQDEKEQYGKRVVDHFSRQAHRPYAEAETLEDLRDSLHIVRTLLQMGHYEFAYLNYRGDLSHVLFFNLEAHAETLSLVRPFFPLGWSTLPKTLDEWSAYNVTHDAAMNLAATGEVKEALAAYSALVMADISRSAWVELKIDLSSISGPLLAQNRLAKQEYCLLRALDLATLLDDKAKLFRARLDRFRQLARFGRAAEAKAMWKLLDPMGRAWPRETYRSGDAEGAYALFCFWQGTLIEDHLIRSERLSKGGKNRFLTRNLHRLRGEWQMEQGNWELAAVSFNEAVRMAREIGQSDTWSETQLALAKQRLHQLAYPLHDAEQLAQARNPAQRVLADLWAAIGEVEQAKKHALAAYRWAWADGEPHVHRYELTKARALLEQLGAEIPNLPPYEPAKDESLPWEDDVTTAIERLREEKAAEKRDEEKKRKKETQHPPKQSERRKRTDG